MLTVCYECYFYDVHMDSAYFNTVMNGDATMFFW